jgi:hypothetical protein
MASPNTRLLNTQSSNVDKRFPEPVSDLEMDEEEAENEEKQEANGYKMDSTVSLPDTTLLIKAMIEHSDLFEIDSIYTSEGVSYAEKVYEPTFNRLFLYEDDERKETEKADYLLSYVRTFINPVLYPNTNVNIRSGSLTLREAKRELLGELSKTTKDHEQTRLKIYNQTYGEFDPTVVYGGDYKDPENFLPMIRDKGRFKLRPYDVAVAIRQDEYLSEMITEGVPPLFLLRDYPTSNNDKTIHYYHNILNMEFADINTGDVTALLLICNVCNNMGRQLAKVSTNKQQDMIAHLSSFQSEEKTNQDANSVWKQSVPGGTSQQHTIQNKTLSLIIADLKAKGETQKLTFSNAVDSIENNTIFSQLKDYAYSTEWS